MPRQTRRQSKPVQIAAAERAEKLVVAASSLNTGFVGNLPNQARGLVQGLGVLGSALEQTREAEDKERKEQDIRDAIEDSQKGRKQANRSQDYADQYSASTGAVVGHESVAKATQYVQENINSGFTLEQMQAGIEAQHEETLKGSEDQLLNINATEIFRRNTSKILAAYADHNADTIQKNKLQNINTDFMARLAEAETEIEVAGIYQAKFDEYQKDGTLNNLQAADALFMSALQQAKITGRSDLITGLANVQTPNGGLLDIPKYRDQAQDALAVLESDRQAAITADNKKIQEQNDVKYTGMVLNGERLPVGQMFREYAAGHLSEKQMTRVISQQHEETAKNLAANNSMINLLNGNIEDNTNKETWAAQQRLVDAGSGSNAELAMIIKRGNTLPRQAYRELNNTDINNKEAFQASHQAFTDLSKDDHASRVMRSEMHKDKVIQYDTYTHAINFKGLKHEEAIAYMEKTAGLDISVKLSPTNVKEFNATIDEEVNDTLGGSSRYMRDNIRRLAHDNYLSGQDDYEVATENAIKHVTETNAIVHGSPLPVGINKAAPLGMDIEKSLNRFIRSPLWPELLSAEEANGNMIVLQEDIQDVKSFKELHLMVDPQNPKMVRVYHPNFQFQPITTLSLHALVEEDNIGSRTEDVQDAIDQRNMNMSTEILRSKVHTDQWLEQVRLHKMAPPRNTTMGATTLTEEERAAKQALRLKNITSPTRK